MVGCSRRDADVVLNATDPRFNPPIFAAAFEAGCRYLDMAMTLSEPHPEEPYSKPGVKLGDAQFAEDERWREAGPARARRDRRRARPLRRLRPLRGRPPVLRDRRGRPCATARTSPSRATTSPRPSRSGRRSRSASTRRSSGSASAASTPPSRSPSRRSSTSPRGSGRSSASTSSTRRSCSCRARSTASASRSSTASATSSSTC